MAFVDFAIVETIVVTGRVHALAAAFALAAAGMDLDRDPLADIVLIDTGPERHDRAHVFMAGREILVERQPALNRRRRSVIDDLEIRSANRHSVDANKNLRLFRHRHWLIADAELAGFAKYPGALRVRNWKFVVVGLHPSRCVHISSDKNLMLCAIWLVAACGRSPFCAPGSPNSADSPRVAAVI